MNSKSEEAAEMRRRGGAKQRAAEELRATRYKLANGTCVKPEFEFELLTIFARNELGAAITMPALYIIFGIASMFWSPPFMSAVWLVLVISAKVLLLEHCRRFLALPRGEVNIKAWRRRFFVIELLNGAALAGFALIGVGNPAGDIFSSHVFIFATLIVVLAIRMTFAATLMPILYAGTVPMTLAVVARLLLLNDPFYFALASMAVGVHLYFVFLAHGLRSTALAMLAFRAEKDSLIAELEEEKSISDEARRRAEAANAAKSRFLATMSHELRTPLNAIMGFSEVMMAEVLGPMNNTTYKDYALNIHESGRHLLHLINEILDLSRIEAGRYELREETVRLADVIEDCHRLMKLKADHRGLQIIESITPGLPHVWVDQRAVRQICLNLLSNSLKFTPKGGRIMITLGPTSDGGQFLSIRDTGPGIPKDELPKVVQAFGQGSLAHQTAEGGTGLGLPIVKNLIEMHGGTFELKSELRKGTECIVTLPKQRVLAPLAPLQPLGHERHKGDDVLARSPRQPRLRQPMRAPAIHPAGTA